MIIISILLNLDSGGLYCLRNDNGCLHNRISSYNGERESVIALFREASREDELLYLKDYTLTFLSPFDKCVAAKYLDEKYCSRIEIYSSSSVRSISHVHRRRSRSLVNFVQQTIR